ncbi:MAG: hypothetical protein ACREJG_13215 [Candidatus Rokuibacteriota bacterium]
MPRSWLILFAVAVAGALAAAFGYLPAAVAGVELHLTAAIVILVGLAVAIGVGVLARKRREEERGTDLQSRLTAALHRDPRLAHLSIVPTPGVSAGRGPITIEVSGQVPSAELRDAALAIVEREAVRACPDHRIHDRLEIQPEDRARRSV